MKYLRLLSIAFHKPFDESVAGYRELERERRIALTALTSVIMKVVSTAIPLITIRITYNYLGVEVYGLWSAVTNFFALFSFSDLGLGNGLQTKLSHASGEDDLHLQRELISSTYLILCIIAAIFFIVFLVVYPFIDWASVMNAQSVESIKLAAPVVLIIVLPRILSIPLSLIGRTQLALQEGYNSNLWQIAGSVLTLVYIFVGAKCDIGKVHLLLGSAIIPVIISVLNMWVYYRIQRPELQFSFKLATQKSSMEMLKLGILFCVLSILTTVGMSMDTFIVAKTCSLSDAASYSIIYKVSIVVSAVLAIFAQPLWGANGEALARGDVSWVKNNTRKTSYFLTIITLALSLITIVFATPVFKIWIGQDFCFSMSSLIWLCIFQIFQAFISPYFMVLNATGDVKWQIYLFALYTPLALGLKLLFSKEYGISAIPAIGALLYLLIIVFAVVYLSNKRLRGI